MAIGIEHMAPLLPADWPGRHLDIMPGDLGRYMPSGFGATPMVIRPWDQLEDLDRQQGFYAMDPAEADPIRAAPRSDPSGGCLYFDDSVAEDDLSAALRVMGVQGALEDYVLFGAESEDTLQSRFLDQLRIVSRGALSHLFGVPAELVSVLPKPTTALEDLIQAFVVAQRRKWSHPDYAFGGRIAGTLGGDGDWAKESLAFGLLVENQYWQVLRIWSRPWLVTK